MVHSPYDPLTFSWEPTSTHGFLQCWKEEKATVKSVAQYNTYKWSIHSHKRTPKAHKIKENITLELGGVPQHFILSKLWWLKIEAAIILIFLTATVGWEFEKVHLNVSGWGFSCSCSHMIVWAETGPWSSLEWRGHPSSSSLRESPHRLVCASSPHGNLRAAIILTWWFRSSAQAFLQSNWKFHGLFWPSLNCHEIALPRHSIDYRKVTNLAP